jgi:hypothetical protein
MDLKLNSEQRYSHPSILKDTKSTAAKLMLLTEHTNHFTFLFGTQASRVNCDFIMKLYGSIRPGDISTLIDKASSLRYDSRIEVTLTAFLLFFTKRSNFYNDRKTGNSVYVISIENE